MLTLTIFGFGRIILWRHQFLKIFLFLGGGAIEGKTNFFFEGGLRGKQIFLGGGDN